MARSDHDDMDEDPIEIVLAGLPIVADLLGLAQASSPNPRLQVVTLAGALAHAAREGGVPDSFVVAMVRAALEGPAPRAKRKVGLQPGRVGKKRQRNHR